MFPLRSVFTHLEVENALITTTITAKKWVALRTEGFLPERLYTSSSSQF